MGSRDRLAHLQRDRKRLTVGAPYSITAASYDARNLPLSLTKGGVVTTYRYDETGLRIAKRVGSGNTEVYLWDGGVELAVFVVNGCTATARDLRSRGHSFESSRNHGTTPPRC